VGHTVEAKREGLYYELLSGTFPIQTVATSRGGTFLMKDKNGCKYSGRVSARSSESPRHKSSSIFFVIILVTSCRSSFNLSRPEPLAAVAVRVSRYSRAVFDMKVSAWQSEREFHAVLDVSAPKPTNA
jgi:hypothetical protein